MSTAKRKKLNTGAAQPITIGKSKSARLYEACWERRGSPDQEFTIREMKEFGITEDEVELVEVCQELLDTSLFILYKRWDESAVYRLRAKTDALKISKLPNDAKMVLQQVEVAGRSGIWKKTLQAKANLHENTVTKAIKDLVTKGLIKEFKTSKNTAKRMYVFHNLEPSEDSTGGVFYREGELDEGLVNTLSEFIVGWIEGQSWREQSSGKHKVAEKKRQEQKRDYQLEEPPLFRSPKARGYNLVPHPADWEYPSAEDVLKYIEKAQVLKDIILTPEDIDQLIQQLAYDDNIEEMSPGRYRSVRRVWQTDGQTEPSSAIRRVGPCDPDGDGYAPGNGLTQSPCGRCPVSSDCRVGGIINPDLCVYMTNWLEQLMF